ncbi:variant erythrocyte surface antigen-1 family protein [Babesia caballi]|uniref:Variant erythrocyte surface antigen-1 family protein n=1 Tax=Babesia caballi TaxID=5871 RepID=A0AAV4M427_BABCB|nr:variant erythrocyte surface antigen-1 family protein [Babesia caballi]
MTRTAVKRLTDCPSNLKEAIDWVLRVTGKDGVDKSLKNSNIEALGTEVRVLLASLKGAISPDVSGIIREIEYDDGSGYGPISKLAKALRVFVGYDGGARGTIEGTGISMRPKNNSERPYNGLEEWKKNNYAGYFFSYPKEATWLRDVTNARENGGPSQAKKLCALILLGSIPILYYGLTYLYWQSRDDTSGVWKDKQFDGRDEGSKLGGDGPLSKFMQAMGYQWKSLSKNKCGKVMKNVAKSLQDLSVSTYGKYSAFLNQLETNAKPNLERHAINYPLYGLYYAACEYFKFQYQRNNNIVYVKNIENTFNDLSISLGSYDDFQERIQAFLQQVKNIVNPSFSEPGSDGPRRPGSSRSVSASNGNSASSGHLPGSSEHGRVGQTDTIAGQPQTAADTISSSVGYVASGIVGTAAVGTGVALATNVGGVTTLIKGAIGMV